jgi:MFS transporter, putative metabolite transport protein
MIRRPGGNGLMAIANETAQPIAYDDVQPSGFHVRVSFAASGGSFSDGYVLGTVGIALSLARDSLHLGSLWLGLLGGASLAGLFLGSLLLAPLADRIGRRPLLVPTMAAFAVISVSQFFVVAPWQLLILRLLLGLMLGIDYVVGCTVVAEFAPLRLRGRLLSVLVFLWAVGYTVAFIAGTALAASVANAWRWILLSSAIPAAIVFLVRLGIPESPPWLVQRGRTAEAAKIIARYVGRNVQLPLMPPSSAKAGWTELFSARYRRRTLVGAVFYTTQVIPYFALGTFIPTVLQGLGIQNAYASGVVFNVFILLGSAFGLWLIDKVTRRQFLVGTFYLSSATLLFLVVAKAAPPSVIVIATALFAFVLSASTNMDFVYLPELFPTRLRASGVGFGTAASRIGSAVSTFMLPVCVDELGIRPTLGICVGVLLTGAITCHVFAPETQGQSIETV